jgi:hypothetical protein
MWNALRGDALLYVEVPNMLQRDASPHNIYFRAHLFYFSIHTLKATLSGHFDLLKFDDRGNVRAIFRKRGIARRACFQARSRQPPPSPFSNGKAGLTISLPGGGILKPFKRLRQASRERTLTGMPPKLVLDALMTKHRAKKIRGAVSSVIGYWRNLAPIALFGIVAYEALC